MPEEHFQVYSSPIWTAQCAAAIDHITIEQFSISQDVLMEEAGTAVANAARCLGTRFLVLAGGGNNGGDAIIAGRILANDPNCSITIVSTQPRPEFFKEKRANLTVIVWTETIEKQSKEIFASANFDCIIDGVTGLGLRGKIADNSTTQKILNFGAKIRTATKAKVLAVDLPSGLNCDDPFQNHVPMPADITVTFGNLKAIHALSPARDLCGTVLTAKLSFPEEAINQSLVDFPSTYALVEPEKLLHQNPWDLMPKSAHKYNRGHVLIIGGSRGKYGAPILSALACLRSGAGWATIALPDNNNHLQTIPYEITVEDLWSGHDPVAKIDAQKLHDFITARRVTSVLVGPGTMENPLDVSCLDVLVNFSQNGGFLTIDAGATHRMIDLIRESRSKFQFAKSIMTPHPGEWQKLSTKKLPLPTSRDSLKELQNACTEVGFQLLFKHASPILCGTSDVPISRPEGTDDQIHFASSYIVNSGTSALARAGSGDVLAGCIAAHGAIGCNSTFGVLRSLCLLAAASSLAAKDVGYHAVLPTDIIERLGLADKT